MIIYYRLIKFNQLVFVYYAPLCSASLRFAPLRSAFLRSALIHSGHNSPLRSASTLNTRVHPRHNAESLELARSDPLRSPSLRSISGKLKRITTDGHQDNMRYPPMPYALGGSHV